MFRNKKFSNKGRGNIPESFSIIKTIHCGEIYSNFQQKFGLLQLATKKAESGTELHVIIFSYPTQLWIDLI